MTATGVTVINSNGSFHHTARTVYSLQAFLSPTARLQHATGAREVIPPVVGTKFMQPDKSEQSTQGGGGDQIDLPSCAFTQRSALHGLFPERRAANGVTSASGDVLLWASISGLKESSPNKPKEQLDSWTVDLQWTNAVSARSNTD